MSSTSSPYKNTYGKRRYRKRTKNNFDKRVAKVAKQVVARELADEVELKSYQRSEVVGQPITNAGTRFSLTDLIPIGDTSAQRSGDKVKLKSVFVRMQVNASTTASYDNVRIIVFRWNSKGTPTVSDILALTTNVNIRHLSQLNHDNRSLFQVKMDQTFIVSDYNNADLPAVVIDKFYIQNIGDGFWEIGSVTPVKGHLHMIVISDSSVNNPEFSMTARVRYTDA